MFQIKLIVSGLFFVLRDKNKYMTYSNIYRLQKNKKATKSPSHQNPLNLIINIYNLV